MTESSARTAATVILGAAGVAAAYVVLTSPPLRRLAGVAVRLWLGTSIPIFLIGETRRAWLASRPSAGHLT
jgi:hypothetical protein